MHELLCAQAKTFVSITLKSVAGRCDNNPWGRAKGQILFQLMHIPAVRRRGEHEVVLWDTVSDMNYVRLSHAKKMCFPWKMEIAVVSTVGGRVETKTLLVYECRIKNLVGETKLF